MPELPEVETVRRDLVERLVGKRIIKVLILAPKMVNPDEETFKTNLIGCTIAEITRRGKLLIVAFAKRPFYLLLHLKMTGQLIYQDQLYRTAGGHSTSRKKDLSAAGREDIHDVVGGDLPNAYTRAIIKFKGGGNLFFNDQRRFGFLRLVNQNDLDYILKNNYGPEPLTSEFSVSLLKKALKDRSKNIKATLLDQKIIAGLGNIYVDEILWAAKINPMRLAATLDITEVRVLWRVIKVILKKAVKYRGTTFSDYVDSFGRHGGFSRFLKVYGRAHQSCFFCGSLIIKFKLAGRGTHCCPHCQV